MAKDNKDRQREWKDKQKDAGMKSVSVMLPAHVKDLIDAEGKRTGTTMASVIERAVLNLLEPVSIEVKQAVTSNEKDEFKLNHPGAYKIYKLVSMMSLPTANLKDITFALNQTNHKTFSGSDEWTEQDVKEILADLKKPKFRDLVLGYRGHKK